MQTMEYYLKDLLYKYDCVTIPGLGGFIMQSRTSRLDRDKNRLYPPSRYPSFNSLLNHDDGLLISAIVRAEKISYHDSGLKLQEFISNCKIRLSLGEKILLDGIGELSLNADGAIRFRQLSQTNFFAGVFGMEPVNSYPVASQKPAARLTQKPADRKPRQQGTKQPASVKWTLILSVPVIIFLLYGIIFPSAMQNLYRNYSGLLFDFSSPEITRQPVVHKIEIPPAPEVFNTTEPVAEKKTVTVVETPVQQTPRYYIIGGCFLNEDNAAKFLQNLTGRGFEAEKAGSNNRGQIRISYKSFPDKTAALSYLQIIRNEENSSAWLLKY